MIVLLSCSTSLSSRGQTINSSTGGFIDDSIKVAINDLRKANIKLIQLDYEKEINDSLKVIINNDDKLIKEYNNNIKLLNNKINKLTTQRNIIGLGGIISILSLIIFIK